MKKDFHQSYQEIFDTVWLGLKSQGFEGSFNTTECGPECAYRGEDGKKCAVGHLISDEDYQLDFEGYGFTEDETCSVDATIRVSAKVKREHRKFVSDLQLIHDTCVRSYEGTDIPDQIQKSMRDLAKRHELTIPGE